MVKYIPQNFLEKICTQLGKAEESDFDRELKKVIFSHVDSAGRLGKASLDELIDYKTSEVNKKIQILKQELHGINEEIVALEEKAQPEYCQKLENLRVQKQYELEAHEKSKPVEVPKPDNDPVSQREISEVAAKIETARKELAECEIHIALASQKQAEQVQLISIADKLLARIENLEHQIQTFVAESGDDFSALGVKECTSYLKVFENLLPVLYEGLKNRYQDDPSNHHSNYHAQLTDREKEILWWRSLGYDQKEVALKINASPRMVKEYLCRIRKKLKAKNEIHAISIAIRRRLIG